MENLTLNRTKVMGQLTQIQKTYSRVMLNILIIRCVLAAALLLWAGNCIRIYRAAETDELKVNRTRNIWDTVFQTYDRVNGLILTIMKAILIGQIVKVLYKHR